MTEAKNYLLKHCIEKLARLNKSHYAIGFSLKSEFAPLLVDPSSKVVVVSDTVPEKVQNRWGKHAFKAFFSQPCTSKHFFKESTDNHAQIALLEDPLIENVRYVPLADGKSTYAVVLLFNISISKISKKPIDVIPFVSATISLLKSNSQDNRLLSLRPSMSVNENKNTNLVDSLLQHTFHPTFIFNEDFKVLKANAASQRLFHSNIERGWPSIEKLLNKSIPSVAFNIFSTISKFGFLGHLNRQNWTDVHFIHNSYQHANVDIQLFDVKFSGQQCFGLMLNEKPQEEINAQDYYSSLQRFNALTNVVPMAILQVDKNWSCSYVNETWSRYSGQTSDTAQGKGWISCIYEKDVKEILPDMLRITATSKKYQGEMQVLSEENTTIWVSVDAAGLFNDRHELTGMIITLHDISDAKRHAKKLQKMANYDHLTGLSNRAFFTDRLRVALSRIKRHGSTSLMFLDLDRFKQINDTLGHPVGDQVIQETAHRLRAIIRDEDSIARLGGDEFAIIFTDVKHPSDMSIIAKKVVHAIAVPLTIDAQQVELSCSVGIAIADEHSTIEDVLKKADLALYQAKNLGRNQFCYYDESLEKDISILNQLKRSLQNPELLELTVVFQPQVAADSGDIKGFEALSRWSPNLIDNISPEIFIKLIEENGLMNEFSFWLFSEVIRITKTWLKLNLLQPGQKISINLSAQQLHLSKFADGLINYFSTQKVNSSWFTFEVTETAFIQDPAIAGRNIQKLKDAGFLIALDDFGTGYSSLGLLRQLPLDYIKIDKSFVLDLIKDSEAAKIVQAILGLGDMLNIGVIAEGVEDQETKDWLLSENCYLHQGFYFYKPLPESKMKPLLESILVKDNVLEFKPHSESKN